MDKIKVKRKSKKQSMDFILLLVTLLLIFIGIVMVFSSSWPEAIKNYKGNQYYFLRKQLIAAILGLFVMIFLSNFNYRMLDKWSKLIFIGSLILGLAVVFSPLGVKVKGAKRWLSFKKLGIPFQFMPSDVMKLGSIIFMASALRKKKNLNSFTKDLLPMLIIIGLPSAVIILQEDLSTTITLAGALMSMVFFAGIRIPHLLFMLSGAMVAVVALIVGPGNSWRMQRVLSFTDPFLKENLAKKSGGTYQLAQSLMALGSGGLFGTGLGKSIQKYNYIPEAHNDFIFAIIGEELGFIGATCVIILLVVLVVRGVRIAIRARDSFGRYLAGGITALIAIQSIINLSVVSGLIPTTGIPLPFISYGGTSLIINMASVGILLNISKYRKLEERS